jgi:zinc/manganese transport system substrate-binding protein
VISSVVKERESFLFARSTCMRRARLLFLVVGATGLVLTACGDDEAAGGSRYDEVRPTVVVTTNILGDVLEAVAGEQVEVVTIMPVGADPHTFQASAQQANDMREADVLVVNGAGFEEGLGDVIDAATDDGTPTFEAIEAVETIEFDEGGHAHEDEEHAEEEGEHTDEAADPPAEEEEHAEEEEDHAAEEEEHEHEGEDPHFFTDPTRMAAAVDAMADFLVDNVEGIDADALRASTDAYIDELEALDAEVEELVAGIPADGRILVTNHEVFGYFADRYGFEVVGTVIPAGSTANGTSAEQLAELAEVIEHEGVPAIFADTSSSDELAQTLADEVGDIEVVELFSESLGDEASDGATYLAMVRTNAERIADALAG